MRTCVHGQVIAEGTLEQQCRPRGDSIDGIKTWHMDTYERNYASIPPLIQIEVDSGQVHTSSCYAHAPGPTTNNSDAKEHQTDSAQLPCQSINCLTLRLRWVDNPMPLLLAWME